MRALPNIIRVVNTAIQILNKNPKIKTIATPINQPINLNIFKIITN